MGRKRKGEGTERASRTPRKNEGEMTRDQDREIIRFKKKERSKGKGNPCKNHIVIKGRESQPLGERAQTQEKRENQHRFKESKKTKGKKL